jgi:hypothetical protein
LSVSHRRETGESRKRENDPPNLTASHGGFLNRWGASTST